MRFLGILLLLSLAACAPPEMVERADSTGQANSSSAAAEKRGKDLYNLYCSSCHGAEGVGGVTWPGNIQGIDPILMIVKNGRGTMPPTSVTTKQSNDIQAYLNSFVVEANNTATSNGEALFNKYCAACHGPAGTGAVIWTGNIQGIDPISGIVKNGLGDMAPVAITDAETAEIQTYLNSFGVDIAALSGIETFANQCASCHGPEGKGTTTGPQIQFTSPAYGKWVTRNGRNGIDYPGAMTAYGTDRVTDVQLNEIIDFLHAQTRPTTGPELYKTLCANCHGTGNEGGPASESLAGRLDSTDDIRNGKGGTNYGSRLVYMPSWSAAELSDAEVDLLNTYISAP
jgi:mono/diheme cytochrome c family protein